MRSSNDKILATYTPNHVLSIYENSQEKFNAAFKFLKDGLLNSEYILMITDGLDKEEIITKMHQEFADLDVLKLIDDKKITILSTLEWYFPDNSFDIDKIKSNWKIAVDNTTSDTSSNAKSDSNGLRVFADVKTFFKIDKTINDKGADRVNDLINYEASLEKRFPFSLNVMCAYEAEDIATLDKNQLKLLMEHHGLVHADNYNELVNPSSNSHIILLYDDHSDLDNAIAEYINQGLRRGQLCVHASIHLGSMGYIQNFSSKIIDYDENLQKGNLLLVDLVEYYIGAITENLQLFNQLKDDLTKKVKENPKRNDKHVRLTADCATFLLINRHFTESINLENWWHTKPFEGSYVCPYPKSLLSQAPYNYYLFNLFHSHDIIIDTNKNIPLDYIKNPTHQSKLVSYTADKILS